MKTIHIQITDEEQAILVNLLESCISDLRVEIAGTDNIHYKEMLKNRKKILNKFLDSFKMPNHQNESIAG